MKLQYCIDCKTLQNIDVMVKVCICTHCYSKRDANSETVAVYGPCKIYEIRKGKFSRLSLSSDGVVQVTELHKLLYR